MSRIPKIIHQIWLGDQARRPSIGMATWAAMNPSWEYRIWSEGDFAELTNQAQFDAYHSFPGRADILRYEILKEFGGFYIDADTVCKRPLDDVLVEDHEAFTCWENEERRPGIMANGFLAGERGHTLFDQLIHEISEIDPRHMDHVPPWILTGPLLLSRVVQRINKQFARAWRGTEHDAVTVFPSHYFLPKHFTGAVYDGPGPVYCDHFWGSTTAPPPEPT